MQRIDWEGKAAYIRAVENSDELHGDMTRTPATELAYLRQGLRHLRRALTDDCCGPDPIETFCRWLEGRSDVLLSSTVRLYRQEVAAAIGKLGRDRGPTVVAAYIARSDAALRARVGKPVEPRTASRKVLDTTNREALTVLRCLARRAAGRPNDDLVPLTGLYVYLAARLGCRPIEWRDARIEGDILIVRSAKNTNGRSRFAERSIGLGSFTPRMREALRLFLDYLPHAAARYPSYEHCRKAMAETLARACAICGVRRLSLYSFRHVAIATWSRAGVAEWAIAALAGHASAVTARRHYAGGNVGWEPGDGMAQPDPERVRELEAGGVETLADPYFEEPVQIARDEASPPRAQADPNEWEHDVDEVAFPKPTAHKPIPDPAGAAAMQAYARRIQIAAERFNAGKGEPSERGQDREVDYQSVPKGSP